MSDEPSIPHAEPHTVTVTVQLGEEGEHPLSVLLFSWMRSPFFKRALLAVLAAACAVMAGLEFVIPGKLKVTPIEGVPGFFGVFGFISLGIAVLAAWPLGRALRRPETYYEDDDDRPSSSRGGGA